MLQPWEYFGKRDWLSHQLAPVHYSSYKVGINSVKSKSVCILVKSVAVRLIHWQSGPGTKSVRSSFPVRPQHSASKQCHATIAAKAHMTYKFHYNLVHQKCIALQAEVNCNLIQCMHADHVNPSVDHPKILFKCWKLSRIKLHLACKKAKKILAEYRSIKKSL